MDCSLPTAPVLGFDPHQVDARTAIKNVFVPHKASFAQWMMAWLDGENIFIHSKDTLLDKQIRELLSEGKKMSAIILFQKERLCSLEVARQFIERFQ
jgi:hypothetical protein